MKDFQKEKQLVLSYYDALNRAKEYIAAGADGLIIEAHPTPDKSISDAAQAINYKTLKEIFHG